MSPEADAPCSLREMELEVEAEGRERMRRRLEEKLQAEANCTAGFFPQSERKATIGGGRRYICAPPAARLAVSVWRGKDLADS